jgi:hypothetical protein
MPSAHICAAADQHIIRLHKRKQAIIHHLRVSIITITVILMIIIMANRHIPTSQKPTMVGF